MTSLFRLRYLIPRLTLLALAALFLLLAINPIIQSSIVSSIQSITGARVEIANVRSSFRESRLQLENFAVADPHESMKNLLEAELIDLKLDRHELLRRRAVVRRGRVIGLKVGSDRTTSGLLKNELKIAEQAELVRRFDRVGRQWLESAAAEINRDVAEIESVRRAKEIFASWPNEYDGLEADALAVRKKVGHLRGLLDAAGDNPLRNLGSYQQALTELDDLGRKIFEIRGQIDRLQQQMMMDREQIATAKRNDLNSISSDVSLQSFNEQSLSEYLLSSQVTDRLNSILKWVYWSRRYANTLAARHGETGSRGTDVLFQGLASKPNVLIETLLLQGSAELGGEPVSMEGAITNLCSQPRLLGKPTELAIQTTGATPMLIQASLDNSAADPIDRVTVDCPRLKTDSSILGHPEQLAVVLTGGEQHVWTNLTIEGESIKGEVLIKQKPARFTPQLHPTMASPEVNAALVKAIDNVDSLDVAVQLSGTIISPEWSLRSNIGGQLVSGLNQTISSELVARRTHRINEAHEAIEREALALETQLLAKQRTILESLDFGVNEIDRVRSNVASRVELTDGLVNPKSPLRETLIR